VLTDPATYRLEPREAWRRIKFRTDKPRALAILREVAAWREEEAQRRDLPRSRILKDETLCEIAAHAPTDVEHLARCRGLSRAIAENKQGQAILAAVRRGLDLPAEQCPVPPPRRELPAGLGPVVELMRVLLKMRCEDHEVAQKLVASAEDLELIAADDKAEVPALGGWRREIFGADALALKHGRLALTTLGRRVKVVPLTGS
jgi:ribonuclease D